MSLGVLVFCLISAIGIYVYGWINLPHQTVSDELLCGLLVLVAYFLGSLAHNGEFGPDRHGGFGPDLSGLNNLIFAPTALVVGLLIGTLFPPWSAAMAIACTCALRLGYSASKG